MTPADLIWNRAAMKEGGSGAAPGDIALSSLLSAHALAMNGGVLHAVELLTGPELSAAMDGYRFFGFAKTADLLTRARELFVLGLDLEKCEIELDREYSNQIPNDSVLAEGFERHFRLHPVDFAPL
jgi:hypothetical protein